MKKMVCNSSEEPRIEDIVDQRDYRQAVETKLDLETLLGVLPNDAQKVLVMRLYGYDDAGIAQATNIGLAEIALRISPTIADAYKKLFGEV